MSKKFDDHFSGLADQLDRMGGKPKRFQPKQFEPLEGKFFEQRFVKIDRKDLRRVEIASGLLSFAGTQITLHLYQPGYADRDEIERGEKPKFHIAYCDTLERMRKIKRLNKYIIHARPSEPFPVRHATHPIGYEVMVNLSVCQNCLNEIRRRLGVYVRSPDKFDRVKFFEKHKSKFFFKPKYDKYSYPAGGYPENWVEISTRIKEKNAWCCNCCQVNLSQQEYHYLLHTHHINGIPADVDDSNLEPLCALCHYNQPLHRRMIVEEDDEMMIRKLREEQDLPNMCPDCNNKEKGPDSPPDFPRA